VSSRVITYLVWALLATAIVATQAFAVTTRRIPTLGELIRTGVQRRAVRVIALAAWLWLGWHFFVRSTR
jgi:hypothetical protein